MRHELEQLLTEVLPELGLDGFHVVVTATADPTHGDYATNIAFQAAKILKISPMEAADKICSALKLKTGESFKKIEIAKPGFINFFLSQKALLKSLDRDTQEVASEHFKGKKIMIEFTDPNPFKEFHIGHLYSNIVGESISRLIERAGGEVRRVCYQGDVGLHVAKAIWGLSQQIANGIWKIAEFDQKSLKGKAKALGEAYALGAAAYEEDPHAKEEIIEINKKVYASISSAQVSEDNKMVSELYLKGRQWSLDYFESIYERLGTEFLHLYFESYAGVIGLELVKKNKDVFKESQGAVVFPGEDYGLHTRVFINSLGLPTYD
ncbi:MAG: arginine--tRNA ligase [Candidatus Levybacteria bacterium]|nr:arginine--tRNA ligase [Candidatus Levybacteria bacterium]